jgi:Tol biopolymer transport system component
MPYHARILTTLGVVAALLLTLVAAAPAAPVSSTVLVDRPAGFGALPFDGVSDASIGSHALSADGRYLVFSSSNDVLLAGDEDSAENVYRLDRSNGTLAQVNVTTAGGQPLAGSVSAAASISANGRYVEFESESSNLVPGGPADGFYVKDMQTGAVELASRATGPAGAAVAKVELAVISGDGRHVAFTATGVLHADNADGAQGATDAYVRALDVGTTHMVSVGATGGEAGGVNEGAAPDIDFNGDAVAFITGAKLSAGDTDETDDAYVRLDIGAQAEMTRFVSFTTGQTPLADTAAEVALSGDGSAVAWSNGFNGIGQELGRSIFMASLLPAVGPARRIDVSRPSGFGSGAGNPVFEPVSSATRFPVLLYFRSAAGLDGADTNDSVDLYAAEIAHPGDGNFVHLETSGKANGTVDAGAGADGGTVVAFASAASSLPGADGVRAEVYVRSARVDVNVSQPAVVPPRTSPAGSSFLPSVHAVSDDGGKVIFQPEAPAFGSVSAFGDFRDQVVVRDLVSGQTALVSAAPDGSPANDFAFAPSLDAAGSHAAFMSEATNLVGDPNPDGRVHAYVRDLATGAVTLVDRNAAGAPLADGVEEAMISPDGRHLVYVSGSADAPGRPANDRVQHVYVVDLATGTTVLADRSGDGTPADRRSFHADISDDGSRVAFESFATNLGAGVSASAQLYVRDLAKNTTTWASVPQDANPMHADPGELSLSRDGTRVAFEQENPQFGFGMTGPAQVFVRDLAAASTTLASLTPGGAVADDGEQPSLSADGSRVSFTTNFDRSPLIPQVFVRDLSAATTTLVSVGRDGGGPARLGASESSLSGNGACVAFSSRSDDLVNPSYGPDFLHVFLRGLAAGCSVGVSDSGAGGGAGGNGGGTGGNGGGGSGGPKPDKTPPRISGARLTHERFAAAGARTAIVAASRSNLRHANVPRGTRFLFSLSESATTTIAITRRTAGRRSGGQCVTPRAGLKRQCTRTVTVLTLTRRSTPRGRNSVPFSGRAGRTRLTPGRYVAQIVARDLAGNRSKPAQLAFTVVGR